MVLIEEWLSEIGLDDAVPRFQAHGIITAKALAMLEPDMFPELGIEDPDDRRKLFILVKKTKMDLDIDSNAPHDQWSSWEDNNVDSPPKLNNYYSSSRTSDSTAQSTTEASIEEELDKVLDTGSSEEFLHDDDDDYDDLQEKDNSSILPARSSPRLFRGRTTPSPENSPRQRNGQQRQHAAPHPHSPTSSRGNTVRSSPTASPRRVVSLEEEPEKVARKSTSQQTTRGTSSSPQSNRRGNKQQITTSSTRDSPVHTRNAHARAKSLPVANNRSIPPPKRQLSGSATMAGRSSGASAPVGRKSGGMSIPNHRREDGSITVSKATTTSHPRSQRTGKPLSSIPSHAVPPMSPLIDADQMAQGPNDAILTQQRTFSDSESERSGSSNSSRSRRRRKSHVLSSSANNVTDTTRLQKREGSDNRRHSAAEPRTRQRAANKTPPRAQQKQQQPPARIRNDGPQNTSFPEQIEILREDNALESDLFGGPVSNEDDEMRIRVVVKKRPMSTKENSSTTQVDIVHPLDYGDYGKILVYQPKTRVDLTKEIETVPFSFDNVFDETASNQMVYERAVRNLIPSFFEGEWASIFAYGQTGSGKTFTMMGSNLTTNGSAGKMDRSNFGLYYMAALDIFHELKKDKYNSFAIEASLFEIYGGKLFDLLNNRGVIRCLEDSNGKVCFRGISEHSVSSPNALMSLIERGACKRSTGTTSKNADSSRSHAVLQLHLRKRVGTGARKRDVEHSRLSFIDLAGSERGADTYNSTRATRMEGAEINTSLLTLKEVIRALGTGDSMAHIPFRGSKLTQVLKESFVGANCRSVMVACISPNIGNCEQTLNTLRYASRAKERNPETGELLIASVASTRRSSTAVMNATAIRGKKEQEEDKEEKEEASNHGRFDANMKTASSIGGEKVKEEEHHVRYPRQASDSDAVLEGLLETPKAQISSLQVAPASVLASQVIAQHEEAIGGLTRLLADENGLLEESRTNHNLTMEDYLTRLQSIRQQQLLLFGSLQSKIKAYREARNLNESKASTSAHAPTPTFYSDDDDSFEDLRD